MKSTVLSFGLLGVLWVPAFATGPAFPEGEILLRHLEGPRTTEFRLVKSTETLRIEQLGAARLPSPANLVDLESGEITIVAPINQSARTLPAAAFAPPKPAEPGPDWEMPAGIGANPTPPGTPAPSGVGVSPAAADGIPGRVPGNAGQTSSPSRIGPDPSTLPPGIKLPEMPEMPEMPGMPAMPNIGAVPGPGGLPVGIPGGIPPMPDFPGLPGMGEPIGELVAHEETQKIHGYECVRHTLLLDRSLELTLWLSDHPDLPPFWLLIWDEPPRFGPRDPMQTWPAIVRKSGRFPLLAKMREASRNALPGLQPADEEAAKENERPVLASWEITSIKPGKPDPALFEIPEGYVRIEPEE